MTVFESATEGQRALHAEALRAYDPLVEARSERIDAALNTRLPGVLAVVILAGADVAKPGTLGRDAPFHAMDAQERPPARL